MASAQERFDAVVNAVIANDREALVAALGSDSAELLDFFNQHAATHDHYTLMCLAIMGGHMAATRWFVKTSACGACGACGACCSVEFYALRKPIAAAAVHAFYDVVKWICKRWCRSIAAVLCNVDLTPELYDRVNDEAMEICKSTAWSANARGQQALCDRFMALCEPLPHDLSAQCKRIFELQHAVAQL